MDEILKLSPRERTFCEAYAECYNAKEAYLIAFDTTNVKAFLGQRIYNPTPKGSI